ncbi:hypothetical protein Tco_1570143 [Tanacetum coccineum]
MVLILLGHKEVSAIMGMGVTVVKASADDPLMPDLEDTAEVQNTGIFGSAYDDDDLDTYNSPYADQQENPQNIAQSTLLMKSWVESNARRAASVHDLERFGTSCLPYARRLLMDVNVPFSMALLKGGDFSQPPGFVGYPDFLDYVFIGGEGEKGQTEKTFYLVRVFLIGRPLLGLWFIWSRLGLLEAFLDSDYAGASLDKKSTTGGCQFLGSRLISWQCKKQTVVVNSTTEAEYIAASHCCGQVLLDYKFRCLDY